MFYSEEQYREYMDEMSSPPPSLADEHAFWHHQQNMGYIDKYACCPLDCGAGEIWDYDPDDEEDPA